MAADTVLKPTAARERHGRGWMTWAKRDAVATILSQRIGMEVVADQSTKAIIHFAVKEWDSVPGMLSGTYWKEAKRVLLCEVHRYAKDRIRVLFQICPGDLDARRLIFEAFKGAGLSVGGNWDLNPQWRQLASMNLFKLEQDAMPDSSFDKLVQGIGDFLAKHAHGYGQALSRLYA